MLHRVIYASETVGSVGASTLSVAQILGAAMVNNRRDNITSAIMFHEGRCLQGLEGSRADLDRLMRRIREDRRHTNVRVLVDKPIAQRSFDQAIFLCEKPEATLRGVGGPRMADVTAFDAERMVELKQAA